MTKFAYLHDMVAFEHPFHGFGYFCTRDVIRDSDAIATGTRSAETNEDLAQSEGCQSGGEAASPNTSENPHD